MDNLTKTQLILLVLLVSFVTSLVTGIVSVSLVSQNALSPIQTISRVIEKVSEPQQTPVIQNALPSEEELIVRLVKNVSPAVVSVVAARDIPVIEQYFINLFGDNEFLIPQYRQKGTERRQISSGTGFFVSAAGLILTNPPAGEDAAPDYSVVTNDGKKIAVKVLARDPVRDIAVLKVEGTKHAFIPLGNSDGLNVGQTVVAIGNALGEFQNTVSVGVISGLRRTVVASGLSSGPEILSQVIQTDAAINPGNSGGPLLDLAGRVIGINVAMAQGAENIGFSLPVNMVRKAVEDVKAEGKIVYPFLGIRYVMINPAVREERKLPVDYGALLLASGGELAVLKDSPAAKAGLQAGDIILEFGGARVDQDHTLGDLIAQKRVGEKVKMKILRAGKEMIFEAALEERRI